MQTRTLNRPGRKRLCGLLLCAGLLVGTEAGSQTLQPAEVGARPLHARLADIDRESLALQQRQQSANTAKGQRREIQSRLDRLSAEKQQLAVELRNIEEMKDSPLVQYSSAKGEGPMTRRSEE